MQGGEDEHRSRKRVYLLQVSQVQVSAHVLRMLFTRYPLQLEVLLLSVQEQCGLLREAAEGQEGCAVERPQRLHEQVIAYRGRAVVVGAQARLQLQEDQLFQEILRVLLHGSQVHLSVQLRQLSQRRSQHFQILNHWSTNCFARLIA